MVARCKWARQQSSSMLSWLRTYGRRLAFLIALTATVASLATSLIFGWSPCELCSLQRIFMYPLVPILGVMVWTESGSRWWVIIPALIGLLIASYHHLLVRFDPTQGCGLALPCSMEFGWYIGPVALQPMYLPLLAGLAFLSVIVVVSVDRSN